ncbi:hypothetical protein [Amycolatopsis sp. WAC 01375]|uniref:hypothetical protein n=1 Tax=Amycolatopsis sp. WAC 01375 TaxID=2203194 RepID=UPI0018F73B49|nr:hypothetical protein [Amycolatopsis sp. WAC 01375]
MLFDRNSIDLAEVLHVLDASSPSHRTARPAHQDSFTDFEYLRYFPHIRHFEGAHYLVESLDGLRHLPDDLVSLELGKTKKRFSLRAIEHLTNLRLLDLTRFTKDIEVVGTMTGLRALQFRSITLSDLAVLRPLQQLAAFNLIGGSTKDLDALPELGSLEALRLWQIRGLSDVSAVGRIATLRYLSLFELRQVTGLPSFAGCPMLEVISLNTMNGLTEIPPEVEALQWAASGKHPAQAHWNVK